MIFLAVDTSSDVPWASTRNLSAFSAVSYLTTLSLGDVNAVKGSAECAQAANDDRAFQRRDDQATSGPAMTNGPTPGMTKKAAPNSKPHSLPQNAPILPHYFIRSPAL